MLRSLVGSEMCIRDSTVDGCMTQAAIDAAFAAWVDGATFGGGCDPSLSVSPEPAPRACEGGSTTVTFTLTDNCETLTETATFTVTPAPAVTLTAPADETVDGCMTQAAIDAAFAAWVDGASFGGGCDPSLSVSPEPAPLACEGGSTTITFTVTDNCETLSETATFTVTPAPAVTLSAPADQTCLLYTSPSPRDS